MADNPPPAADEERAKTGVLRAELGHLKEFLTHRLDRLEAKVDQACDKMEDQASVLQVHEQRLEHVERFQEGLLATVFKYGSIGAGVAITVVLIVAGLTKAWGWW